MADVSKSEILKKYPIGIGLDIFREACPALGARGSPDAVEHLNTEGELPKLLQDLSLTLLVLKSLALDLFIALQNLPLSRHLPSSDRREALLRDLARLVRSVDDTNDFDIQTFHPLLSKVARKASDEAILDAIYELVIESTPLPPGQLFYPH
jgi:hypothetical protein